ncbi:MAG: DUF4395 domain-containing protein [Candidatus Dormibacteraeota bacterium]|nr:DUF4395 domain-containing protein [Candidatus Dormibacteraeota bacterium]
MEVIQFDRSVLKVNQVILMTGLVAGYFLTLVWHQAIAVLPLLAVMMLAGLASPQLNLPRNLYLRFLKPRHLVRPRLVNEDPAPHRFAQLVGGVFLVAASVAGLVGQLAVAWTLGWIVVALAFLNFAFDICVGCIVYAQLVRLGLLPLRRSSPA